MDFLISLIPGIVVSIALGALSWLIHAVRLDHLLQELLEESPSGIFSCSTKCISSNSPVDIVCREHHTSLIDSNPLTNFLTNPWFIAITGALAVLVAVAFHEGGLPLNVSTSVLLVYGVFVFTFFVWMLLHNFPLNFIYALVIGVLILAIWSTSNLLAIGPNGPTFSVAEIGLIVTSLVFVIFVLLDSKDTDAGVISDAGGNADAAFIGALLALILSSLALKGLAIFSGQTLLFGAYYDIAFSVGVKSLVLSSLALGVYHDFHDGHKDSAFPTLLQIPEPDFIRKDSLETGFFHHLRRSSPYAMPLIRMANRISNIFVTLVKYLILAVANVLIGIAKVFIKIFNVMVWLLIRIAYHLIWTIQHSVRVLFRGVAVLLYSLLDFFRIVFVPVLMFSIAIYYLQAVTLNTFAYMYNGELHQIFVAAFQILFVSLSAVILVWALTREPPTEVSESLLNAIVDKYSTAALLVFLLVSTFLGIRGTLGITNILGVGIPKVGPFRIGPLTIGSYAIVVGAIIFSLILPQQAASRPRLEFARLTALIIPIILIIGCCVAGVLLVGANPSNIFALSPVSLGVIAPTRTTARLETSVTQFSNLSTNTPTSISSAPVPTNFNEISATQTAERSSANPLVTSFPSTTPSDTFISNSTPTSSSSARVNANTLLIRSGPGTSYDQIGRLQRDDLVTVLGRNSECDWLRIRAPNGTVGWVKLEFLEPKTCETSLPIFEAPPTRTVVATATSTVTHTAEVTATPGLEIVADSASDFAGSQGNNSWSFMWEGLGGRGSFDWRNMPTFGDNCWRTDSGENYIRICRTELHPGLTSNVGRQWRSTVSGTVRIDIHGGGDGVDISVCKFTDCFKSYHLSGRDSKGFDDSFSLSTNQGDLIYFVVKIGGDATFDATDLSIRIYRGSQ